MSEYSAAFCCCTGLDCCPITSGVWSGSTAQASFLYSQGGTAPAQSGGPVTLSPFWLSPRILQRSGPAEDVSALCRYRFATTRAASQPQFVSGTIAIQIAPFEYRQWSPGASIVWYVEPFRFAPDAPIFWEAGVRIFGSITYSPAGGGIPQTIGVSLIYARIAALSGSCPHERQFIEGDAGNPFTRFRGLSRVCVGGASSTSDGAANPTYPDPSIASSESFQVAFA